jgi:hypothetical protein
MKRGQVSSIDALIAILIFVLVLTSIRTIWMDNVHTAEITASATEINLSAQQAFDVLTKTQGWPTNWTTSNVSIIGLADKPNVLSEQKVSAFESISYNTAKNKLSLQKYEFSFDINSTNPSYNKHIGSSLDGNTTVVLSKRVIYKGGEAIVTLKVFSP